MMSGDNRSLGRRFGHLWAAFALSSSGDGFAYGAVPLLAVVVDPRPLAVSAVIASDSLPWLLAALPAGSFADRFERGRLMAVVNITRGVVLAVMAALVGLREMDLVLLLVFVLANGTARAMYYSASQAAVPELVGASALARANGVLTGTEAATEHLVGPILGTLGFVASRALPFVADASAVGVSGLAFLGLRTAPPEVVPPKGSIWEGGRLLLGDRRLRVLVMLVAALAGLQGLVAGVLVLIATRDWGVHASLYGVFVAAGAVGNIPGALLAGRIAVKLGSAATLLAAAVISGAGYIVMAIAHSWLLAGSAFALVGFAVAAGSVVAVSLRQQLTPNEIMGRVGSAWRGIVWGAAPVGALLAGALAVVGGLRLPLVLAGLVQCLVAVVLARPLLRYLGKGGGPVVPGPAGAIVPIVPTVPTVHGLTGPMPG
jgi:MFS family permease